MAWWSALLGAVKAGAKAAAKGVSETTGATDTIGLAQGDASSPQGQGMIGGNDDQQIGSMSMSNMMGQNDAEQQQQMGDSGDMGNSGGGGEGGGGFLAGLGSMIKEKAKAEAKGALKSAMTPGPAMRGVPQLNMDQIMGPNNSGAGAQANANDLLSYMRQRGMIR
jgi:hypothetical protein